MIKELFVFAIISIIIFDIYLYINDRNKTKKYYISLTTKEENREFTKVKLGIIKYIIDLNIEVVETYFAKNSFGIVVKIDISNYFPIMNAINSMLDLYIDKGLKECQLTIYDMNKKIFEKIYSVGNYDEDYDDN